MKATETRTPINQNYLQQDGFIFVIKKCPTVQFFTQQLNVPGLSLPPTEQPNPFIKIPIAGDHIEFEDLNLTFKVDEDLKNWSELYNWIVGQGYPDDYDQYKQLYKTDKILNEGLTSDISVISTSNIKNPNIEIVFRHAFPIYLSGFNFDTTSPDVQLLSASVSFKYQKFDINVLPR